MRVALLVLVALFILVTSEAARTLTDYDDCQRG